MASPGLWISEALRPAALVSRPGFAMPDLACDAHMHVFGPIETYPPARDAKYTTPEGSLDQYRAVAERLGIARMVFVQASFYGTDNRCILDAMARVGPRSRGVIFLPADAPTAVLNSFHDQGVRGIRLDLFKADRDGLSLGDVLSKIAAASQVARQRGWHLEFYAPGLWVRRLLPALSALDIDFSVNHMGYMTAEEGLTDDDFARFLELARSAHCWVKLTGPYRVAPDDAQQRPDWMARALIAAAPERVLWGTDWPHIPQGGRDSGEVLQRLALWCPDAAARGRILVENPARLYDFA